jgi:single-strand DNA-binding protein
MTDIATATVIGRIGRDPEQRQAGDSLVTDFALAVSESKKLTDGTWKEHTSWFKVVGWRNVAQRILGSADRPGLGKGTLVAVTGRLRIDQWTTRDGKEGTTVTITADTVQKLKDGKTQRDAPPASDDAAYAGESEARRTVIKEPANSHAAAGPARPTDDEPPF